MLLDCILVAAVVDRYLDIYLPATCAGGSVLLLPLLPPLLPEWQQCESEGSIVPPPGCTNRQQLERSTERPPVTT